MFCFRMNLYGISLIQKRIEKLKYLENSSSSNAGSSKTTLVRQKQFLLLCVNKDLFIICMYLHSINIA